MKTESTTQSVCLAKDRSLSLIDVRGARIRCAGGALWITQDRDQRDIVLAAGESFTVDRDGLAIVSALVGSSVELRPAQPHGAAGRVHQDERPPSRFAPAPRAGGEWPRAARRH